MTSKRNYRWIRYRETCRCPKHGCICKVTHSRATHRRLKCPLCDYSTKQLKDKREVNLSE